VPGGGTGRPANGAVDNHGHGTVVDEGHGHVGAEAAGLDGHAERTDRVDQPVEQRPARLRGRGGVERRPAALAGGGGHREVAHQQDRPAGLLHVQVEVLPAVGAAEGPQPDQFAGGPRDVGFGVRAVHGGQHEQAGADRADRLPAHLDRRPGNALDDRDHGRTSP
jgi:hypothetical protein